MAASIDNSLPYLSIIAFSYNGYALLLDNNQMGYS